ncbi:MAG: hypothetical protein JXA37_14440 [Chloroflexia bacterium]|nr:hypothetical protein [Chloroflexia bacterium]
MNISHYEEIWLTCPHCEQNFGYTLWLLVDAVERPELAAQVQAGTLRQVQCPHCQETIGWLDAPLLYHDASQEQLIFAPSQGTTRDRDSQDFVQLLERLQQALPDAADVSHLEQPVFVPLPLLPAYLTGGNQAVEAALDEMWEQSMRRFPPHVQTALRELKAAEVETIEGMSAFLDERPELREALEIAGIATSQLQQDLLTFAQLDTWGESKEMLESHPELLAPPSDSELARMIDYAQDRQDEETVDMLQEHRQLLQRCRRVGLQAAFLEKISGLPLEEAEKLLQEIQQHLLTLSPEMSSAEIGELLSQYPILLNEEALDYLHERAQEMDAAGQAESAGGLRAILEEIENL